MPTPNKPASDTKYTLQNTLNNSYDEDFNVIAVEILGYDSDAQVLRRIKVSSTGALVTTT